MGRFAGIGILTLAALLFTFSSALAGFDIPSGVYRIGQLDEALDHAEMYGRPITFVYANKRTDCGLAAAAARDLFKQLGERTVLIYLESGEDWGEVPALVKKALKSEAAGRFIPRAVIVDQNLSEVIQIIPYAKQEERGRLLRQAKKKLGAY
ncbi:MAG: hypothetical protein IH614_13460 [Desulfuromonadales bacterium]|nr:hypothetical protein [Desulfuromonadales bacterium]